MMASDRILPSHDRPVLLCFDGSRQAGRAIAEAGLLLGGGPALVVHVWEPLSEGLRRHPEIGWPARLVEDEPEIDAAAAEQAREIVQRGVELALEAGFDADPVISKADHGQWAALAELARQHDVRAIVVGSHGLSTAQPLGLGGVAKALLEHCERPTLVVGIDRESVEHHGVVEEAPARDSG